MEDENKQKLISNRNKERKIARERKTSIRNSIKSNKNYQNEPKCEERHQRRGEISENFELSIWRLRNSNQCLRPYHVENTSSRPITEVKQRRARLVLGWVTAWEHRVL